VRLAASANAPDAFSNVFAQRSCAVARRRSARQGSFGGAATGARLWRYAPGANRLRLRALGALEWETMSPSLAARKPHAHSG